MNRLLFLLLIFFASHSQATVQDEKTPDVVTYGELLLKEEGTVVFHNFITLNAGFESGNPLLDVYNFSGSYSYQLYDFFELGFLLRSYSAQKTALLNSVEQNFALLGVDINAEVPEDSYYFTIGVLPLKGRLNFFGLTTLTYHWVFGLGLGERRTEIQRYSGYLWSIESRVFLKKEWAILVNFNQEAEAAFNSRQTVHRNQINLGIGYGF